jgi:hypothetical protein
MSLLDQTNNRDKQQQQQQQQQQHKANNITSAHYNHTLDSCRTSSQWINNISK